MKDKGGMGEKRRKSNGVVRGVGGHWGKMKTSRDLLCEKRYMMALAPSICKPIFFVA